MVKVTVKYDCEHGAKGAELDVEEARLEAFLAEGKVEVSGGYQDFGAGTPVVLQGSETVTPEPAAKAAPAKPRTKEKHRR